MRIKPETANIPLELLRALVAIAKTATPLQAAGSLGLAPSVLDAQIKELERTLGAAVVEPSATGGRLSEYGKIIASYAERMLSMNDQVISQSQSISQVQKIRAGLPRWVLDKHLVEIVRRCSAEIGKDRFSLRCDHLEHLMRDLGAGLLDVALLCNVNKPPGVTVMEWWEDMYWVKSPDLVLTRGAPIPLVSWPGSMSDRLANQVLGPAGIDYVITFTAADLSARVAAVAAGLGVMAVPERVTGPDVRIAREDFLPSLPKTRKGLYVRNDLDPVTVEPMLRVLEASIRPSSSNVVTALFATRRAAHPRLRRRQAEDASS